MDLSMGQLGGNLSEADKKSSWMRDTASTAKKRDIVPTDVLKSHDNSPRLIDQILP